MKGDIEGRHRRATSRRDIERRLNDGMSDYDVVVIGGGFYGARIALLFAGRGKSVLLVERERELMARASLLNQARVHHGYHYPRSILTSLRSQKNYARFVREYRDCLDQTFAHYYAIARGSKVSAAQFVEFCRRIGAPIEPAPERIRRLFDKTRVEAVFAVEECAFDATKLRGAVKSRLAAAGVDVKVGTTASLKGGDELRGRNAGAESGGALRGGTAGKGHPAGVELRNGETRVVTADTVVNATYSGVNDILGAAGAEEIPLKYEMTELALVEPPAELEGAAVTVMDGAYFSIMPYPSRRLFTLSHVRYTPHYATERGSAGRPLATHFTHMILDAARYLPAMRSARYVESLWEMKAIMPRS